MSITAPRAIVVVSAAAALALPAGGAQAQVDQRTAANILVECSKIGDSAARLACYDNNIRNIDPAAPMPGVPGSPVTQRPPAAQGPQGFGFESVRVRQQRFDPVPAAERELQTVIASAREREPGIYLVTLQDGAEWIFTEGVDFGYRPPRRGQAIEIERGALGSFIMRIDDQEPVQVRRLR